MIVPMVIAKKNDYDFVFSDFKRIIDSKNQRDKTFNYVNDKIFDRSELSSYFDQNEYDNRVTPKVIVNINAQDLVLNPSKN